MQCFKNLFSKPTTSPLYDFTGDYVIPKGTIKLVVTMGEHPRVSKMMTEFFIVDCLSAFNGVIGIEVGIKLK